MTIREEIQTLLPYLGEMREALHRIPEIGLEEYKTQAFLYDQLRALSPDGLSKMAGTGVVARFTGTEGHRTVAFRADIDALEIAEQTGLPYASEHPGKMHACGHDGHMAALLTLAKYLAKNRPKENTVLLFQPAEENFGGAKKLVDEGALAGVDEMYGQHVYPDLAVGKIASRPGPMMASVDDFDIHITGHSSHGALPQYGVDSGIAAAHVLLALQSVVSRNVSPTDTCVLTAGIIRVGTQRNIIPEHAMITITTRTFKEEVHDLARRRVDEILCGAEIAFGVKIEIEPYSYYPAVVNPAPLVEKLRAETGDAFEEAPIGMVAEDFSFYQRAVPACFFYCGVGDENHTHPLHHEKFCFEHAALLPGVETFARMLQY